MPTGFYRGIDRDPSAACDQTADLAGYTSTTDGLLLRHVLEHNLHWRGVLRNALASSAAAWSWSYPHRSSEPPRSTTAWRGPPRAPSLPEIRFCRGDLVREFRGVPFRLEENVPTDSPFGREHVFYLCKDGPA